MFFEYNSGLKYSLHLENDLNYIVTNKTNDNRALKKVFPEYLRNDISVTKPYEKTFIKETRSVTMNIFRNKKYFLFKLFVKIELNYVFTINMFSTAENCMKK